MTETNIHGKTHVFKAGPFYAFIETDESGRVKASNCTCDQEHDVDVQTRMPTPNDDRRKQCDHITRARAAVNRMALGESIADDRLEHLD